jgi:hypothetical protein
MIGRLRVLIPAGAVVARAGDHTNDPVERINALITLS